MDETRQSVGATAPPKSNSGVAAAAAGGERPRVGYYRWTICALLFFATTINYVDRQVLGILSTDLQKALHWNELQYGNIVAAFNAAYALGLLGAGRLIDRFGTRIGYSLALTVWSIAAMGHALARSALGFGVARAALGLGEAGNFPAAIKTVAEWFPKKERALATGIFNSGSNIGAIVAPLAVPYIAFHFVGNGHSYSPGVLVWCGWFWMSIYERPRHPRVTKRSCIHPGDPPIHRPPKTPGCNVHAAKRLVCHRQGSD
jgi:ACS family hexuronate transporter-like MFS transporter